MGTVSRVGVQQGRAFFVRTGWACRGFAVLAVAVLVAASAAAGAGGTPAVQVWVQEGGGLTLTLRSDGTYTFSGQGVSSSGRFATESGRIAFQDGASGVTTVYAMEQTAPGVVTLVDPQGNRLSFRLQEAPQGAAAPAAGTSGGVQPMILVQKDGTITLTLRPDDTYLFEGPGFRSEGRFEMKGSSLVLHDAGSRRATAYTLQAPGDGTVHLVDPEGSHLVMALVQGPVKDGGASPAPAQPGAPTASATASVPPAGSPGFLYWFLASLPSMGPDDIYAAYFFGLNDTQRLMVSIKEALNASIFQQMCMGSHAAELRYNGVTGMGEGCGAILEQARQAAMYGSGNTYAEEQRQELMIEEKCNLGLIDGGSCGAYRDAMRSAAEASGRTTETIVGNMAPPPCTRYYTPDEQYLGCW